MKSVLKKAKTVICKSQENITRYYNRYQIFATIFNPSDKIYLDVIDIYTIYPLVKLVY